MCGRFVAASTPDEIARYFDAVEVVDPTPEPNFNVAPSTDVAVVLEEEGVRRLDSLRWGLVPLWAKDPSIGNRMINARAEGLADKNAFKHAYRRRRCIVAADGFYEWKKWPGRKTRQPYYFHRADDEPLALAGLWESWHGPGRNGSRHMRSVTIVTTRANDTMMPIHDRMPVILPPPAWARWLDRDQRDVDRFDELLVPAPSSLLVMHPVSTEVNHAVATGPELIEPIVLDLPDEEATSTDVGPGAGTQGTLL